MIINARDAAPDDHKISIRKRLISDKEQQKLLLGTEEPSAEHYIAVSVVDKGSGIPADVLERVFEPYFSTKKRKGTGLGLATVLAIVRAFGGEVSIASQVGEGTEVTVILPAVEIQRGESEPSSNTKPERLKGGNEKVLVVDDEDSVRNVLAMSLRHMGYDVETAASGAEALELFEQAGAGTFQMAIVDMLMPEMSGEDLFYELLKRDPELSVLVVSGYSSEKAVERILQHGGKGFIQKPFTIDQLSQKIRECLPEE